MIMSYFFWRYFLLKTLFLRVQDGLSSLWVLSHYISRVSGGFYPCTINMDILSTIFLSYIEMTFYISSCHSNFKIGSKRFMRYRWKNSRDLSLVPNCSHSLICHLAKDFICYHHILVTILIPFQFPNSKHLGNLGYHRNDFSTYV